MKLTGLHLLLTYQCNLECDHCFVYGSPWQTGTMTLKNIRTILKQAKDLGTIESIYFEGGEPFLYYPVMLKGVQEAADAGFKVGMVSNSYWATDVEDAIEWLRPFAGLIEDLSVSSDCYHSTEKQSRQANNAVAAAKQLGIPLGVISIAQPEVSDVASVVGVLPESETKVMYRGRAAEKLVSQASLRSWEEFDTCPFEDLRNPGRLHVDPLGNMHICQGISLGNLFQTPLRMICEQYIPDSHPISGPLLHGGPVELARKYAIPCSDGYADACHLCFEVRRSLRGRFPDILMPDQMYGVMDEQV
jgi:organic radical activating enzyme